MDDSGGYDGIGREAGGPLRQRKPRPGVTGAGAGAGWPQAGGRRQERQGGTESPLEPPEEMQPC